MDSSTQQRDSGLSSDIRAVVTEMYAMISGPAGPRDWRRQEVIFHPDARMMRCGFDANGDASLLVMTLQDYRENTAPFFVENGFYEIEIGRHIDVFGNMAQVWSAYEARLALDEEPDRRGINSIQLQRDARGDWRIVSMIWDVERPGLNLDTQSFQKREA